MTDAERELLVKTAETLVGAMTALIDPLGVRSDTVRSMQRELLDLLNRLRMEEVDRRVQAARADAETRKAPPSPTGENGA